MNVDEIMLHGSGTRHCTARWGARCVNCGRTLLLDEYHAEEALERALRLRHVCEVPVSGLLVVGEQPNRADEQNPLGGRAGRFLADLGRLSEQSWLTLDRRNLIEEWTERWDRARARATAERFLAENPARLLLCGRRVATAFDLADWPLCSTGPHPAGPRVLLLPHPSGRNRWWNEPENRARAGEHLAWFLRGLDRADATL